MSSSPDELDVRRLFFFFGPSSELEVPLESLELLVPESLDSLPEPASLLSLPLSESEELLSLEESSSESEELLSFESEEDCVPEFDPFEALPADDPEEVRVRFRFVFADFVNAAVVSLSLLSALTLSASRFLSCLVRELRCTYLRFSLHSYDQCPICKHF